MDALVSVDIERITKSAQVANQIVIINSHRVIKSCVSLMPRQHCAIGSDYQANNCWMCCRDTREET